LQRFAGEMGERPAPRCGVGKFAGLLFGERDEVRQGLGASDDTTDSKNGCKATNPTGTKSRGTSSGRLAWSPDNVTKADEAGM